MKKEMTYYPEYTPKQGEQKQGGNAVGFGMLCLI